MTKFTTSSLKKTILIVVVFSFFMPQMIVFGMGEKPSEITQRKPYVLGEKSDDCIELLYLNFNISTLLPVTKTSIESEAQFKFYISKSDLDYQIIKQIFQTGTEHPFEDGVVRLKIKNLFSEDIYLDQDKVYTNGKSSRYLSEEKFLKLKNILYARIKILAKKQGYEDPDKLQLY